MEVKRSTIYDVAKLANTSVATVSRVLSNKDYHVSEELKEKVLIAAKELGYTLNLLGRNLKSNKSSDIGVIIPTITNPYYTMLVKGVEETAAKSNYDLFLCNVNRQPEKERKFIESLMQKQVAGIILASIGEEHKYLQQYRNMGTYIVSMDQTIEFPCDKVTFDFFQGGYLAGKHLVSLGHKNIAFLSAPIKDRHSRREIIKGFKKALAEKDIELEAKNIIEGSKEVERTAEVYEYKNAEHFVNRVLEIKPMPTALFCINDMTAIGVLHQLQVRGIKIPQDISVMGFDNIPISEVTYPGLTTIEQNAYQIGSLACSTLINKIENKTETSDNIILKPSLIIRGSTGEPG